MEPLAGWSHGQHGMSALNHVSADGSVIVGGSYDFRGTYIWDEANGVRRLPDVLTSDYGLGQEIAGWNLTSSVYGISADGRRIVGQSAYPQHLGKKTGK